MSKTVWSDLDLEVDANKIEVVFDTDGDEQELVSDVDDPESGEGDEEAQKSKQKNQKNEAESEEDDDQEKTTVKKRRRGGRAAERIRALSDKLKQKDQYWQSELNKVREEIATTVNTQKNSETVSTIQQNLVAAKQKLAKAKENGDYVAEADALADLTQLTLDLRVAQAASNSKRTETKTDKSETITQKNETNQVPDAYKDWVDENPWFEDPEGPGERKLVKFIRKKAAELVNDDGYTVEDDEFYEELTEAAKDFVNKRKLKVDGFEIEEKVKSKTSPVGGGKDTTISKTANGGAKVHLTRSDKEMADRLGVSYVEYAQQKVKAMKTTKSGYSNIF